ncbi:polyadenylate-binding protein 4-like [Dendrobium catenatum]|uniref:Polyadenylate-binding protein n=1 Tax=Dendrobium catenatum TaxID=906689 RepID=A0A2I0VEB5_9ASPA|nr:polyadenylate-binding protein 4-like [Dendrobium catenatum]PKU61757.1 putative polyadenylate-binding protein [Dendrobium catenatum]
MAMLTNGTKSASDFARVTVPVYVGDLHPDVTNENLMELFSTIGEVDSVRVCRDFHTGCSRGYGYVNYISCQDAINAIEKLNHTVLCGKPIRVMKSHHDPDLRNSGIGNVFVKNLSRSIDSVKLKEMFLKFGTISSCKVATEDGKSKGFGFVQFDSQVSANMAIENLNGIIVDGKKIYVGKFIKKNDRKLPNPELKFTNLYMKNLDKVMTKELIELKFSEFGKVFNVAIEKDEEGNPKGFGFVNFANPESAKKAVEAMNGLQLGSKKLYVARAQKKAERKTFLCHTFQDKRNEQIKKNSASNLYVKNIADNIDDSILWEHFSQFGTITSAKVMHDDKGNSKGFGFVCFSTQEEASKALNTLHGHLFYGKPLYVAIAQRKEERQAQLLRQYSQRMAGVTGLDADVVPTSYPQVYYSPSKVMKCFPSQQYLMYKSFGLRSGCQPSGFVRPSRPVLQRNSSSIFSSTWQQRPNWAEMNADLLPQSGKSILSFSHLLQLNHSFNSNGQQTNNVHYERQEDMNDLKRTLPASSNTERMEMLNSMLATTPPQQQKQMLGQHLFPLVQKLKAELAAKITGMLLQIDNSELLLLLESPEALAAKVEEAAGVLELSKTKMSSHGAISSNNFSSAEIAVN